MSLRNHDHSLDDETQLGPDMFGRDGMQRDGQGGLDEVSGWRELGLESKMSMRCWSHLMRRQKGRGVGEDVRGRSEQMPLEPNK